MVLTNDFVFIHFPKNAGSFVTECLQKVYDGRSSKKADKKWGDYITYLINRENTQYAKKYISKSLGYTGEKIKSQHQGCDEIPIQHQEKPILSTIRNPFDRYVSQYKFGWWKKNPVLPPEKRHELFPNFPDLDFGQYLDLVLNYRLENTRQKNNISADMGIYSLQFIQLFCKNYMDVLSSINDIHQLDNNHFYTATFLHQEQLRDELYDYLQKQGWPESNISFIRNAQKVNTSRDDFSYRRYYSQEQVDLIKEKEALIFRLFPDYSF
ncbi:hypothetical protein LX73_2552 [Fodinibius salinus]|uniref:Sulfotransferase family protein n=1 Tax=Fodinibius salinus TaxID=860790 RepID=A0A5D3YFB8_9BACT|nr:sulfotransferase family 2 domain-containing protein [Fodinibius salinus]TYP91726.1 hypothetical protein LX73_2552 [Fodinibius salinus]